MKRRKPSKPVDTMPASGLPSESGFAALKLCNPRDYHCIGRSCWHHGIFRRNIAARLAPPRLDGRENDPPIREYKDPRTPAEIRAAGVLADIRALVGQRRYEDTYGPGEHPTYQWGSGGVGCRPNDSDVDGVGSWGTHVRQLEDVYDER